jgi:hypothetical protein
MSLVSYTSSRLTFKKAVIDGLASGDRFQITTPFGVFEMSKSDFLATFANVAASKAYRECGVYNYSSLPAKALPLRLADGSAVGEDSISRKSAYPLPVALQGKVELAAHRRWIHVKAAAHVKRDKKRWGRSLSISSFKQAIHQAVLLHDGTDPYTGEALRWDLLRTYNNDHSKLGRSEYKRTLRLLPTIDHIDNGPCDEPVFQILSWEVNDAKNDMPHDSFIELCRKVASRR